MDYNLYWYPHGTDNIFTGMTQMFMRYGYPYAWSLWREIQPDTSSVYKQIVGRQYVARDKQELSAEIMESFMTHKINYIMPSRLFRIYMSFDSWDDTHPYFAYMMDGASVGYKYYIKGFEDNWGLIK
jgi:hypothetical protein